MHTHISNVVFIPCAMHSAAQNKNDNGEMACKFDNH